MNIARLFVTAGGVCAVLLGGGRSVIAQEAEVTAVTIPVREAAESNSPSIDTVFAGDRVEVLERDGDWAKIRYGVPGYGEITGWVPANSLVFSATAAETPVEAGAMDDLSLATETETADSLPQPEAEEVNSGDNLSTSEEADTTAYSGLVTAIAADCTPPQELMTRPFTTSAGQGYVSYYCWNQPTANAPRTGQWLGTVPTTPASDFVEPLTCNVGDATCEVLLPQVQTQYPEALAEAELACAAKQGTLFIQAGQQQVDIRCGYFATTVYDSDNDGQIDYEDPISVDVSMFTAELEP